MEQESRTDIRFEDFSEQEAVQGLVHSLRNGTWAHAYIITGAGGTGKSTLIDLIACYLVCKSQNEKPCCTCPECRRVLDRNHPDVIRLAAGKPIDPHVKAGLKSIPVDDIRAMIAFASRHTYEGGKRVIVIDHAENMNANAQNALLKTLEEPLPDTVLLLETDKPRLLLSTIISRCREIRIHAWSDEKIITALKRKGIAPVRQQEVLPLCDGSVGQAIALADDESYWNRRQEILKDFFDVASFGGAWATAAKWKDRKGEAKQLLDDIESMIRAMLMVHLGCWNDDAIVAYPDAWRVCAQKGSNESFVRLFDAVTCARRENEANVTWQAVLEKMLRCLVEEKKTWSM